MYGELQLQDVQKWTLLQRCFQFLRLILHVIPSAKQKRLTEALKVPIS